MKALTTMQPRVMVSVAGLEPKQILEAKFKLANFGYTYGYYDKKHYWSFPEENAVSCLEIIKSIFKPAKIKSA
jgi:hypothetical protein